MIKCDPQTQARCPYKNPCGDNPYYLNGSDCDKFSQEVTVQPSTNADRIRAISDEELADWLTFSTCKYAKCGDKCPVVNGSKDEYVCATNILGWLSQPAEED